MLMIRVDKVSFICVIKSVHFTPVLSGVGSTSKDKLLRRVIVVSAMIFAIFTKSIFVLRCDRNALRWRVNGRDSVSNHRPHGCLLNRLFRRKSKKTSKLRVTGLCAGNSPETGDFPAQMASNAENVSIWWRRHGPQFRRRVTHVPWSMSGSLTHGGGENVPDIPGACATLNFTYLARGPCVWFPS